jgi:hypothetical protein
VSEGRNTAGIPARRSFDAISSGNPVVAISRARKVARIIVIVTASIGENAEKSGGRKAA